MRPTVPVLAVLAALATPATAATGVNSGYAGFASTNGGGVYAYCEFAYRFVSKFGVSVEVAGVAVSTKQSSPTSVTCTLKRGTSVTYQDSATQNAPAAALVGSPLLQGLHQLTVCVSATSGTSVARESCAVPVPIDG